LQARRGTPGGKIVVVIDNDRAILQAMEGLLRIWGYRAVTAVSDSEALDRLAHLGYRPDLIVCDDWLAGGTFGVQAIERLREAFEIPAILITGGRTPVDAREGRASHYQTLLKPLKPELLKDAIDQVFKDKP
jgi:CheY-like chemotaxis protein